MKTPKGATAMNTNYAAQLSALAAAAQRLSHGNGIAKGMGKGGKAPVKPTIVCNAPGAGGPVGKAVPQTASSFKNILAEGYAKKNKVAPTRETFVYETTGEPGTQEFTSCVTSETFTVQAQYHGTGTSKKDAEQEAAKAALIEEYPEIPLPGAPAAAWGKGGMMGIQKGGMMGIQKGGMMGIQQNQVKGGKGIMHGIQKNQGGKAIPTPKQILQAATAVPQASPDSKVKLNAAVMLLAGGTLKKDDVVYSHAEDGEGNMIGSVNLACLDGSPTYQGEPIEGSSKAIGKLAENSAAQNALNELEFAIVEAQEAKKEEKKAKKKGNA